ncbi:YdcH family protein [Palleronia sp.]|uniref:YdcH family protein n=1 Tax=Palleronia sp. TaxID=1940284 RepID=UPI0035C79D8B
MSVSSHVQELRRKHQALAAEVEAAQRRPAFDESELKQKKRQKLRLKEQIERLTH